MDFLLEPWQFFFAIRAGWVNRQQQEAVGYDRIQGALAKVGHEISDQTVGNILQEHGIEPTRDPKRQTTWATFIKAHWHVLASIDFTTIEVLPI